MKKNKNFDPIIWSLFFFFNFLSYPGKSEAPLTLLKVFESIDLFFPELEQAKLENSNAQAQVEIAGAAFIPRVSNRLNFENYLDNSSNLQKTKRKEFLENSTEIIWQSPLAFEIVAGISGNNSNLNSTSNAINFTSTKDSYFDSTKKQKLTLFEDPQLNLNFRMPLLRDLLIDKERAELKKTLISKDQARAKVFQKRAEIYLKAAQKYWDWIAAGFKYKASEKLLELVESRRSFIQRSVEEGAKARIDLVELESQVQKRKALLTEAFQEFQTKSISLASYLWKTDRSGNYTPGLQDLIEKIPEPDLKKLNRLLQELENYIQKGLEQRPELEIAGLKIKQKQIKAKLARNNLLPRIDLMITPSQSLGQQNETNLRASLYTQSPIVPQEAKAKLKQAINEVETENLEFLKLKNQIALEIRKAVFSLEQQEKQISFYQNFLSKLNELSKAGRTRLELGSGDLFKLNLREIYEFEAQVDLIKALANYQKAFANYEYVSGNWTRTNNGNL